jgi:hypothetical protein
VRRRTIVVGLTMTLLGAAAAAVTAGIEPLSSAGAELPQPWLRQRHTMHDFHGLREGSSYDEAARTLGHLGHEVLRPTPEDIPAIPEGADVYSWPNPNGSRIVLVFVEDRLVDKRQFGLR